MNMFNANIIVFTTIIINVGFLLFVDNYDGLHVFLESALCGVIFSLLYNAYKTSRSVTREIKSLNSKHSLELLDKQREIDEYSRYTKELINNVGNLKNDISECQVGDIYYMTDNGGKLHKNKDCDAVRNKELTITVIHPCLIQILDNADRMCKMCRLQKTDYVGVEIFHTRQGSRAYTSVNDMTTNHRKSAQSTLVSRHEYNLLRTRFPDVIIETDKYDDSHES